MPTLRGLKTAVEAAPTNELEMAWILIGDLGFDLGDLVVDFLVGFHVAAYGADGVEDGGMVAAAEVAADFF